MVLHNITNRYEQDRYRLSRPTAIGWAIHHSVSPDFTGATRTQEIEHLDNIADYHLQKFNREFGYHAAAFPSGRGYICGDYDTMRAHVCERNHRYLGLVFIGTFTQRKPLKAQLDAAREIVSASGLPVIGPHRNLQGPSCSPTVCPGQVPWDEINLPPRFQLRSEHDWQVLISGVLGINGGRMKPLRFDNGKAVYELTLPNIP